MGFKPDDYKPTPEEIEKAEKTRAEVVPAAQYAFAFISMDVLDIKAKPGVKRVRGKIRILDSQPNMRAQVGKYAYLGFSLDVSSAGVARFVSSICSGMGLTNDDEFDPKNVYEVKRAFLYRPIVCELKVATFRDEEQNEWGRVQWRDKLRPETIEKLEVFRQNLIEEFGEVQPPANSNGGSDSGPDGDPGPSDADAPAGNFF